MASTIRQVLARDPGYRIEPVVKVYDRASLLEDLRQFVITDSLARELAKFFDGFNDSLRARIRGGHAGDGMAAWVWGFFGCGKSHVAKVVGHVLENDVVEPETGWTSMDHFRVHLDDPGLPAATSLKAALQEIRTHAWCKTIPFEIKSKADPTRVESITEICLRAFYEALGLAPTIWVARLEHRLQRDGRYEAFLRAYREQNGREWATDRESHGFYMTEFADALAVALGRTAERARETMEVYQRDHARVTPENAVAEWLAYLDGHAEQVAPREPHLIFVIDEMGQFIADSGERIHELQAIIEQAGNRGHGRIWFVCTSQEALDQVVDRTGIHLSALGKLDARVSVRIPLTGEDVRNVVQERLLRKNESTRHELEALYQGAQGPISDLCDLRLERRLAALGPKSFIGAYPFLPHAIPLVQELFNAMRGFKLSGTERSMIGLAQGALRQVADRPVGEIIPLDLVFDQVIDELSSSDYLGTAGVKAIREADAQVADCPLPPSRVLKALWLISRVEWVPRTPEVLARLLAKRIGADVPGLRRDIETTLDRLAAAGHVGRDEATGQYRYLTEAERSIEEDVVAHVQGLGSGIGVAKRRAAEIIKGQVFTSSKLGNHRVPLGRTGLIPFGLKLDGEALSTAGEITIEAFSPLASPDVADIEMNNLGYGTKGRTLWWIAAGEDTLLTKLKRLDGLDHVLALPRWRNDQSNETPALLSDKEKEMGILRSHVATLLEDCFEKGRVFYAGEQADLDGGRDLSRIVADYVPVVAANLYTHFSVADRTHDEKNLDKYLDAKQQNLRLLDPALGLFDAQDQLSHSAPLVSTIYEELKRREDEGQDLTGSALVDHFGRIPFGWPEALVRLVLAAMLRGGALNLVRSEEDLPVYDVTDAGLEKLFTSRLEFRKAVFHPTVGQLKPDEVESARQALIAMGETNVPDAAHSLAQRVREVGQRFVGEAKTVAQRAADLSLPLSDAHRKAEPVTTPATSLRDPVACVRRFITDREEWLTLHAFLSAYDDFVANQRDTAYRDYERLVAYAREWLATATGQEADAARAQLAEFDAVVASREIMRRWKALQEAALAVMQCYATAYRGSHEACAAATEALQREVQASDAFCRLEASRQKALTSRYFGPDGSLALPQVTQWGQASALVAASTRRKISALDALRLAVPGYRSEIYAACEQEWKDQQGADEPEGDGHVQPQEYTVNVRDRMAGRRFASPGEFQTFWDALRDEVMARLKEGVVVKLEG